MGVAVTEFERAAPVTVDADAGFAGWYPNRTHRGADFGGVLQAAATGAPDAANRLLAITADKAGPSIVGATALDRLRAAAQSHYVHADRPHSHLNLGSIAVAVGVVKQAIGILEKVADHPVKHFPGDAQARAFLPELDQP
jgi:hypothetical protein